MKDNLFDEKQLSDIKKYTGADAKLIYETKKLVADVQSNKTEKSSSVFRGRMMRMAAVCCVGLICGILSYRFVFKGDGQKSNVPQNNEQTYVAENSEDNNMADGQNGQSEQNDQTEKNDQTEIEKEDSQHIVMAGGADEEMNIVHSIKGGVKSDDIYGYDTFEELTDNSEEIVKGTVIDRQSSCSDLGVITTRFHVVVEKTYKGKLGEGDVVTVSVPGGIIPLKEYLEKCVTEKDFEEESAAEYSKEDLETGYVESTVYGEPVVKEGENGIFFMWRTDYKDDVVYAVSGVCRGRFIIDGNKIKRYLPKGEEEKIKVNDVNEFEEELGKYL